MNLYVYAFANFSRDLWQGQYAANTTGLYSLVRHAKDNRGCFILCDSVRSSFVHGKHSGSPIVAHAGHDNSYSMFSFYFRDGMKQYVHRRTMAVNQFALINLDGCLSALTADSHVVISRGYIYCILLYRFKIFGFFDFKRT